MQNQPAASSRKRLTHVIDHVDLDDPVAVAALVIGNAPVDLIDPP